MSREPKEGELYNLKDGHGWCRHGLVVIHRYKDRLIAVDTYWNGGAPRFGAFDKNWDYVDEVRDRLTFLLDLNTARRSNEDECEVFADEDRAYIPVGGGSAKWYVRTAARPVFDRQVARLERKIREANEEADSAIRRAQWFKEDLKNLREAHNSMEKTA